MSLIELYCDVDDFCQAYTKREQSQKLHTKAATGLMFCKSVPILKIYFGAAKNGRSSPETSVSTPVGAAGFEPKTFSSRNTQLASHHMRYTMLSV